MAERTTAKEVKIDLDAFKGSIDRHFSVVTKWIVGLYVALGAIVGTGFLLRTDLGNVQAEVAKNGAEISGLRRDVTALQERLSTVSKGVSGIETGLSKMVTAQEQISSEQRYASNALSRIERRFPEINPIGLLALDADDRQAIRAFFNLPAQKSSAPLKISIGEKIGGTVGDRVPDELALKVQKLKGLRYFRDPSTSSVIFVADDRVVGIVEPG